MKLLNTYITALMLVLITMTACQKNDNFLVKEEAFSVITSGFNGSENPLEIMIDTTTLQGRIDAGQNFKRTDRYTFPAAVDSVKLIVKEKDNGKQVYEKEVKRGDYSVTIELFYVGGKLIEKPVPPVNNPEGIRLVSYLFLPGITKYSGDIDIVYFKKFEVIKNGQFKIDKLEELERVTTKPYMFSAFLQMPVINGGWQDIDGINTLVNPMLMFFKSGTNIPYYENTGATVDPYASFPVPLSAKPQIVGITEWGTPITMFIGAFQQVQFN